VGLYGLGFLAGSLRGASGGDPQTLKRRYLIGLFLTGIGGLGVGLSPALFVAAIAFTIGGFGNGLFVVHQRLLFQSDVPEALQGRIFGLADALTSWGFAVAFILGGALIELAGVRTLILFTGAWEISLALLAGALLRGRWKDTARPVAQLRPSGTEGFLGR
jgi:MFS family permease